MKQVMLILCLLCCAAPLFAKHSKGGYLVYRYLGTGSTPNTSSYEITVVHYVNCKEVEFELSSVFVGIFTADNKKFYRQVEIQGTTHQDLQKQYFDGCISPKPDICFYLAFYITTIELPDNPAGYILAEQECCRAEGILNVANSGQVGSTNSNNIPGVIGSIDYHTNSSPLMAIKDTAVICHNSPFSLDFGTTDPNGDDLQYEFCDATSGGSRDYRQPKPPSNPPYDPITYNSPYSGSQPMGKGITINPQTGLISGIAPDKTGNYTLSVCITEYRKGVAIATTKKEILVTVADCSLSAASLQPSYINCDSYSFTFSNESYANNVSTYAWDFGVPVSDASLLQQPTPTFTYKDTGTYHIKLTVTSGDNCTDTASSFVKIYPGFLADFTIAGSCFLSPFIFTDASYAKWGQITSYRWDFGDLSSTSDTLVQKNASYQYATVGNRTATLMIASDKGCRDTMSKTVEVNNKPYISAPFTDTLICSGDRLPVNVTATGDYLHWSPADNISNVSVANPIVYPTDTTLYTLTVHDKQCIDSLKLKVNVIDFVTLSLPAETKLCATDSVLLQPASDALYYNWQQSGNMQTLSNTSIKAPKAAPLQTTTYSVTGSVGHCSAEAKTDVLVSPYPVATVSNNASICYGNTVQLHANTVAAHYTWSPATSLLHANTLNPLAGPQRTTAYVFTFSDTFFCTKNVYDTVLVNVVPLPVADAGDDTTAVTGQPLRLTATANEETSFRWSPVVDISNATSSSPVVTITDPNIQSITYFVTAKTSLGCTGTDSVHIKVFSSQADIFIPSAFTPDGDGVNDIFKPITPGIAQLYYFRVFNRLGELLYETKKPGEGWDGLYKGRKQPAGAYVYAAAGVDYKGTAITKRGTVVMIR